MTATETLPDGTEVAVREVDVGGARLQVAEAGEGPAVVLLHGFPELWWSWRHQVGPLVAAGHRVLAPNQRGYDGSDRPAEVEAYALRELVADVVGLLDAAGEQRAVVVGHDWGANVAWQCALRHPDRFPAVAGLSVPLLPRAPAPPIGLMRQYAGEDFYVVWFQEPGVGEAALERDVRRTLSTTEIWGPAWAERADDHPPRPAYLDEADLERYVAAFERSGFTGPLSWYRNLDRNWEESAAFADRRVEQPALFMIGSRDPVKQFMPPSLMEGLVTDLESIEVEGAGHWLQQQAVDEVNAALLTFVGGRGALA